MWTKSVHIQPQITRLGLFCVLRRYAVSEIQTETTIPEMASVHEETIKALARGETLDLKTTISPKTRRKSSPPVTTLVHQDLIATAKAVVADPTNSYTRYTITDNGASILIN
jgi:hypothetical protein